MKFKIKNIGEKKRAAVKSFATGFTLLVIPNSTDEAKTTEISYDRLVKYIAACAAVVIIIVGLLISMAVHNHRLKLKIADERESIEELESENNDLNATIDALKRQIQTDRDAFSKIENTISMKEEEQNQAKEEAAVPTLVPIKGSNALVVSDPYAEDENMRSYGLVFSTFGGALVVATGDGYVVDVQQPEIEEGYNSYVFVDHQNGYRTYYRFRGDVSVKAGDTVSREDVIGVLTQDGYISYEVSLNERFIDPKEIIKQ